MAGRALAFVLALTIPWAALSVASAQEPVPPRIYHGEIQATSSVCGGGTITLETNGDMTYVSAISIEQFNVSGDGVTSVPLYLSSRFDPGTVPIAEGGDFANAYFRSPYEPSLEAVHGGSDAGVGYAFTLGLRYAYLTMMVLLLVGIALSAFKAHPQPGGRGRPLEETPGRQVRESQAAASHPD